MNFEFATATRIIFGSGRLKEIGGVVRNFGKRALIVTGQNTTRAQVLVDLLAAEKICSTIFSVSGEPTIQQVEQGSAIAREAGCDFVIAFGGGSALDAGKTIAAMLRNDGALLDYLEVIGRGQPLRNEPAPFIAIPTTSGTGSEVTRNAVLASSEHRVKVSLRSPLMLPKVALVDAELTLGLPPGVTASTGMDALTQLIEPFTSCRANPVVDALCREAIPRAARSLRVAFRDGSNLSAREDMALASLFGGLALANAGLGAVHGFAAPIGGMFSAPHGAICAALLPHVMATNLYALRSRQPQSEIIRRYDEIARMLTGESDARADDAVGWVSALVRDLNIPPLKSYGIRAEHFADVVEKAVKASSMKANPIQLTREELSEILRAEAER